MNWSWICIQFQLVVFSRLQEDKLHKGLPIQWPVAGTMIVEEVDVGSGWFDCWKLVCVERLVLDYVGIRPWTSFDVESISWLRYQRSMQLTSTPLYWLYESDLPRLHCKFHRLSGNEPTIRFKLIVYADLNPVGGSSIRWIFLVLGHAPFPRHIHKSGYLFFIPDTIEGFSIYFEIHGTIV